MLIKIKRKWNDIRLPPIVCVSVIVYGNNRSPSGQQHKTSIDPLLPNFLKPSINYIRTYIRRWIVKIVIMLIVVFIISFLLICKFIYSENKQEPKEEQGGFFMVVFVSGFFLLDYYWNNRILYICCAWYYQYR